MKNKNRSGVFARLAVRIVGFTMLVAGVFAHAWRTDGAQAAGLPRWLPLPIGSVVATLALVLWRGLVVQEQTLIRRAVEAEAARLKTEIQEQVRLRILALERIARMPQEEWEADAALYVAQPSDYQAIAWVDTSYYARWIVSRQGNEAALNQHGASEEQRRAALEAARHQRAATVTQTLELAQGDKGVQVYVPLFVGDDFDGFIRGVFRLRALLDPIVSGGEARGYEMALFDGEEEVYGRYAARSKHEASWGQDITIALYNVTWRGRVWPSPKLLAGAWSAIPETALAMGLLTALLLAFTVHLAQTARLRAQRLEVTRRDLEAEIAERKQAEAALKELTETLERRVAERTKELAESRTVALSVMEDAEAARQQVEETNRALAQEIAERDRIGLALRASEDRFRLVVEASPNAFVMINQAGEIIFVNAQTEALFGYSRDELVGLSVERLIPARFREHHVAYRRAYVEEPAVRPMGVGRDLYGQRKDGSEFPVEVGLSPITVGGDVLVLSALTDITQRKQAEEDLKRYAVDLERSNRELEQFAYVASHDLQEPLRKVTNVTQLFARRYQEHLDEKADTYIDYVVDGARRMQGLINDLLAFSRVGTRGETFAATDLETVLDDALYNLDVALVESGADVTREPLPTIQADGAQLRQVFQNLIGNAIKFRGETPPAIHVGAEQHDGAWRFWVRDNGIGIDPEYAERIFVIFQRLHAREAYPGTGIGLAICKKIVERHGGRIWVESLPGEGSTFYFILPIDGGHPS